MTWRHRNVLAAILDRIAEAGDQVEAEFPSEEVESWPSDALILLNSAKLLREAQPDDAITCRGCEERCRRTVTLFTAADNGSQVAVTSCHLFSDKGPFEHDTRKLRRWSSSREMVTRFVRRSVSLQILDRDDRWRRVRFNTLSIGGARRAFSLEFNGTSKAKIGSTELDLIELFEWDDAGIKMDLGALALASRQSEDGQSGNKRTQPSTTLREDNKLMKELRNRRVQRAMDEFAPLHPNLNKESLAKLIVKAGRGQGMTWSSIARVTRMPEKM